jgi:hypothetical protein
MKCDILTRQWLDWFWLNLLLEVLTRRLQLFCAVYKRTSNSRIEKLCLIIRPTLNQNEEIGSIALVIPLHSSIAKSFRAQESVVGLRPVALLRYPPQIPNSVTRAQTGASAVRGRRLTAWAMARPKVSYDINNRTHYHSHVVSLVGWWTVQLLNFSH